MNSIKVVVVGDGNVGKTSMLMAYVNNTFPTDYVPTVFDNFDTQLALGGRQFKLNIWDTAGQETFARLRPLAYPKTDVFLVVFSISSRNSMINTWENWYPELKHFNPLAPSILIGNKKDLRESPQTPKQQALLVSPTEGARLAEKVKAETYMECSAKTHEGLKEIFEQIVRIVTGPPTKRSKEKFGGRCVLL